MMPSAHFVGSIGLSDVEEVFRFTGTTLGTHLKRIPDGEPGGRRVWISWQYPVLLGNPLLETEDAPPGGRGPGFKRFRLAPGVKPEELQFGELGYAREARASYQDFVAARSRGAIAPGVRFQVSIPTPINVIGSQCTKDAVLSVEPAYEAAMLREIDKICRAIPHQDLCVQFDMVREIIWWDGRLAAQQPAPFADIETQVIARLGRIARSVPAGVELGYHICYGDWGGRHHIQPVDMGAMVVLANAIVAGAGRPVAYFHMPVPIDRDDEAYFAPLRNFKGPEQTELYLGLIHLSDGLAGAQRRIAAARKSRENFGVATECGLGRAKTPETVKAIIRLYGEVCAAG
ncbi:MAG TPA: hypothetical protein VGF92_12025 [Stellaceae bacterium]|jgi:hypothetical protein